MIEKMIMVTQEVPTELAVRVIDERGNKTEVYYEELGEKFGYEFKCFPKTHAKEAVEEIVRVMESQSYDHGASWRRTSLEEVQREDEFDMYSFFQVTFRIRDSY